MEPNETLTDQSLQETYPSIDLAYPIAIASYENILKRIDALENRTQTLMVFATTLTVAIPAMTAGRGLTFRNNYFITALVFFAIANLIGIISRFYGDIILLSPQDIYRNDLGKSEREFKKDTIYWAGENFSHNNQLLLLRHRLVIVMLFIFLVEAVALAVWASGQILT